MNILDGSLLLIRPKRPMIEWACSLGDDVTEAAVLAHSPTAYLVADVDDKAQLMRKTSRCMPGIFESELSGWSTDPDEWPAVRDARVFKAWFEFELIELVHDARA